MALETVAHIDEIPLGTRKVVKAGGNKLLLFRLDTGFYATQAYCPHLLAPLKSGKLLNGHILQCPFHRAQFDITNGTTSAPYLLLHIAMNMPLAFSSCGQRVCAETGSSSGWAAVKAAATAVVSARVRVQTE